MWILVLLSLALTAATLFPDLTTSTFVIGFGVGAGIGVAGGCLIALSRRRADRLLVEQAATELGDLDPDQIEDLDDAATGTLSRDERKPSPSRTARRGAPRRWRLWTGPCSPLRKAGCSPCAAT